MIWTSSYYLNLEKIAWPFFFYIFLCMSFCNNSKWISCLLYCHDSASPVFLFLLTFMGAAVLVKHNDWNTLSPFALDRIAMRTTILAVFVYCMVVIIHERFSPQISSYITISNNIRFLSGTLAMTSMFLILVPAFGWLLLVIWLALLVKVAHNLHEPFHDLDKLKQSVATIWRGGPFN